MNTPKKTEQSLFILSGKSEAEVTEDCAQRIVLLKPTSDRYEASRGLSVTPGLLAITAAQEVPMTQRVSYPSRSGFQQEVATRN